jgi:hypothetical protein
MNNKFEIFFISSISMDYYLFPEIDIHLLREEFSTFYRYYKLYNIHSNDGVTFPVLALRLKLFQDGDSIFREKATPTVIYHSN